MKKIYIYASSRLTWCHLDLFMKSWVSLLSALHWLLSERHLYRWAYRCFSRVPLPTCHSWLTLRTYRMPGMPSTTYHGVTKLPATSSEKTSHTGRNINMHAPNISARTNLRNQLPHQEKSSFHTFSFILKINRKSRPRKNELTSVSWWVTELQGGNCLHKHLHICSH